MKPRPTLFARIMLWFFLSLLVLVAVLIGIFQFQFQLGPLSPFRAIAESRLVSTGRLIAQDLNAAPRSEWDDLLAQRSEEFGVEFLLYSDRGHPLAGSDTALPPAVHVKLRPPGAPPPQQPPPGDPLQGPRLEAGPQPLPAGNPPPRPRPVARPEDRLSNVQSRGFRPVGPPPLRPRPDDPPPGEVSPGAQPPTHWPAAGGQTVVPQQIDPSRFLLRTPAPTRYWGGVALVLMPESDGPPMRAYLLAVATSLAGNHLFFDPKPWLVMLAVVGLISILIWLPLVRGITAPISRMTAATERIARGDFAVKLDEGRRDEVGRLGRAINNMATRLSSYVTGQKRFLGDMAHELGSPLARIQLGLGILERQVDETQRDRLLEVQDEVEQMSNLVNELLSFSRAEANPQRVQLTDVALDEVVTRVVEREGNDSVDIRLALDDEVLVTADAELLTRALANLLRNAIRYAGDAGPLIISANRQGRQVTIEVRDSGPGVPAEHLDQLFEPFFRPQADRGAATGGVGLGLAIVRTCVEACQGRVSARNLSPRGFAVAIELNRATAGK